MDSLHFSTTRGWLIATLLTNPAWFWFFLKFRQCKQFSCFVACFLSRTSYYGFLQKHSCPTRLQRLEAICHFASSGWYSSLWLAEYLLDRCLWISLTQVYTPFMASMVTSVLCSCWKGAEVLLVSVPKAYLESAQAPVLYLLPWKSQHNHKGVQTHPSPPSKVIFLLQEPYKVHVQQALSAEAVRLPVANPGVSLLGSPLPATPLSADLFSWAQVLCLLTWLLGWS